MLKAVFIFCAVAVFTVTLAPVAVVADEQPAKPNLVLFLADDCTYRDLGCYGSINGATPTLDRLASEGMLFARCYQASPMCSPTRHNLFTGVYPVRTGAYPNHTFADDSIRSLPHYLKGLGYRVGHVGKWHIAPKEVFPFERLGDKAEGEDFIDLELVSSFIQEATESEQPFCIVICSHQPHGPYTLGDPSMFDGPEIQIPGNMVDTPQFRNQYAKYLAEVNFMDGQVDTVLGFIDQYQVAGSTLVVYLSEQGSAFPMSKWTCYEDGVRSAMIARWPGVIEAGSVSNALIEYSDIVPTFIDAAGGSVPDGLDGVSLLPVFLDPSEEGKPFAFSMQTTRGIILGSDYFGIRAVTDGRYRYIHNLSPEIEFSNGITVVRNPNHYWGSWRELAETDEHAQRIVNQYLIRPQEELYDLRADPDNLINLAGREDLREIQDELKTALFEWMSYCGDEGLRTELLAYQRMRAHRSEPAPVLVEECIEAEDSFSPNPIAQLDLSSEFVGFIQAPRDGYYTFTKKSGSAAQVSVAGRVVVPAEQSARYGIIRLRKGFHAIVIVPDSNAELREIVWSGPDMKPLALSAEVLHQ